MTINEAFDGKVDFEITRLVNDDREKISEGKISFEYARPEISIDNKTRYVTHDIIGGKTVRQKIGEEPREVSISGIVIEETATELDKLRDANTGRIKCDRLPSGTMNSQFPSVSTSPMSSGGSARIEDGKLLYRFDMKAIEVNKAAPPKEEGESEGESTEDFPDSFTDANIEGIKKERASSSNDETRSPSNPESEVTFR